MMLFVIVTILNNRLAVVTRRNMRERIIISLSGRDRSQLELMGHS